MKASQLGVAIAGLGFGEKVHLPALYACPATTPVALWHRQDEKLQQSCSRTGLWGSSNFKELLANPEVEALIIATPPEARFQLAKQALLAGKHVLLEKPVALNSTEALQLEQLALAQGCCCAINFEYRAVPAFQQLAELLRAGWIGEPWLVRFDWLMESRSDPKRPWNWYAQQELGGGVLGALGSHAFDMMEWLVGPIVSLQAQLSVAIKERPMPNGNGFAVVDAADTALIQMQLQPHWSASKQFLSAQLALSSVARQGRGCWLEFYGSEGTLVLGSSNQADYVHGFGLQGCRKGETMAAIPKNPAFSYNRTWEDGRIAPVARLIGWWAQAIREAKPMVPGLLEGLQSQIAMDACQSSHFSGNRVLL